MTTLFECNEGIEKNRKKGITTDATVVALH